MRKTSCISKTTIQEVFSFNHGNMIYRRAFDQMPCDFKSVHLKHEKVEKFNQFISGNKSWHPYFFGNF